MQATTRGLPVLRQALLAASHCSPDAQAAARCLSATCSSRLQYPGTGTADVATSLTLSSTSGSGSGSASCSASDAIASWPAAAVRSFAAAALHGAPSAQWRQQLQHFEQRRLLHTHPPRDTSTHAQKQGSGHPQAPNKTPLPSDDDDDDVVTKAAPKQQQGKQATKGAKEGAEEGEGGQQFGNPHSGVSINEIRQLSKGFVAGTLSQEELWLSGVEGRLKIWSARQHPELKGREKEIADRVRGEFLQLFMKHAEGRILSHQARRQLKLACLAIATYRVLLEVSGGREEEVLEHIEQSMGSLYAPFLMGSLKASGWFRRLLLGQKPIDMAVQTLRDIAKDMEDACDCLVEASDTEGRLTVNDCMFYDITSAESATKLLKFFCCQHNVTWLEAYGGQGVKGELRKARPRGDDVCEIVVTVTDKHK